MKKLILSVLCLVVVAALTGCGKEEQTQPAESHPYEMQFVIDDSSVETVGESIDFSAQYIRTNGYHDGEEYPKTFWITNVEEMNEYYELNKEMYFLESIPEPDSHQSIGFTDAIKKYDAEFFEDHDLIFVVLEEGSGSIRHEVTDVRLLPSMADRIRYFIQPEIKRIVPEVGTADMAEWHIIIEIGKEFGRTFSELKQPEFTKASIN